MLTVKTSAALWPEQILAVFISVTTQCLYSVENGRNIGDAISQDSSFHELTVRHLEELTFLAGKACISPTPLRELLKTCSFLLDRAQSSDSEDSRSVRQQLEPCLPVLADSGVLRQAVLDVGQQMEREDLTASLYDDLQSTNRALARKAVQFFMKYWTSIQGPS